MTIRTNPPGALVFVDYREIGVTPVSTSYTYHGTREIEVFKDGFETVHAKQRFPAPWYQWPVIEFFSENLWPFEIRDERYVDFNLVPQQIVRNEDLLERAQSLRTNTRQGHVTPMWDASSIPVQGTVPPTGLPTSLDMPVPASNVPPNNLPPNNAMPELNLGSP